MYGGRRKPQAASTNSGNKQQGPKEIDELTKFMKLAINEVTLHFRIVDPSDDPNVPEEVLIYHYSSDVPSVGDLVRVCRARGVVSQRFFDFDEGEQDVPVIRLTVSSSSGDFWGETPDQDIEEGVLGPEANLKSMRLVRYRENPKPKRRKK